MQTYVNPPVAFPELDLGTGSYGLAHEAVNSKVYLDRLIEIGKSSRYLILDNGADELGTGMSGDAFFNLLDQIQPDEVIAPDVIGDSTATQLSTRIFLDQLNEKVQVARDEDTYLSKLKVMAVAQGLNYEDWINCYLLWLANDDVDVIGIPYDIEFSTASRPRSETEHKSVNRAKNRLDLIAHLNNRELLLKPIHLLGMNNIEEFSYYGAWDHPMIRSNDTTAPFAAGFGGRKWTSKSSGNKDWKALSFDIQDNEISAYQWDAVSNNLLAYFLKCDDLDSVLRTIEAKREFNI